MTKSWFDEGGETSSVSELSDSEMIKEILNVVVTSKVENSRRFDTLDSANEEITRLGKINLGKTETIEELNTDLIKVLNVLKDDISSKNTDYIYNLELILGSTIVITAVIFSKTLGLILFPMIILGSGIFFTSYMSKRRGNKMRKEYGF